MAKLLKSFLSAVLWLLRNKKIVFLWTSLFVAVVLSIFNFTHGSRFPSQAPYSNPYAGEEQGWRGRREDTFYSSGRAGGGNEVPGQAPRGGWRDDGWGGKDNIPMGPIPARHPSSGMQRDIGGEWTNLVCLWNTDTQSANYIFDYVFQFEIL